jgi:rare lipoprotein A
MQCGAYSKKPGAGQELPFECFSISIARLWVTIAPMHSVTRLFILALLPLLLVSCGGGGYKSYLTRPYTIRGVHYQPLSVGQALGYKEVGIGSWYNESKFFGLKRGNTSLGEKVMAWDISAAHKTLPLPCVVKVTNLSNGKSLKMRVNDRGPFIPGRIIDVTPRAAGKLGFKKKGLTRVRVEVVSVGDGKYKRKARRRWFGR